MDAESDKSQPASQASTQKPSSPSSEVKQIAELVNSEDFPRCALGALVDIGGYTGVVAEIVNQSLKVRSSEGQTKSFNAGGLRRIYGRPVPPPPVPRREMVEAPAEPSVPARLPEEPTIEPDFTKPVRPMSDFVKQADYPRCILREHVQIADYSGVVVQIVNRSLKVRSMAGATRSYNADALRRLHGAA
jgi:hypothetical protein